MNAAGVAAALSLRAEAVCRQYLPHGHRQGRYCVAGIARDNDAEGERAAERLARRCARAGVAAAVIVSEGGDFNDDLLALGPHGLAARLAPLFRPRK